MSTPLITKLRQEASSNPKKAAILGVLLVVAAYFWAPLLRPWISSAPDNATATATATAEATTPASSPAPAASAPSSAAGLASPPAPLTWREVAAAIDRDPRMRPAIPSAEAPWRDPFTPRPRPEDAQLAETEVEPVEEVKTPSELGVTLSGTIVGARRRSAVINGKVYGPGRELKAAEGFEFVIKQIEPWGIVLQRGGKTFELALPRPQP